MDSILQAIVIAGFVIETGIPTALFYGAVLFFAWKAWRSHARGEERRSVLFTLVALVPPVWFGITYAAAVVRNAQIETAVRQGEALPKLTNSPRVLVIHAGRSPDWERLVEMGAFDTVYLQWPAGAVRLDNARRPGCDGGARGNITVQNVFRARTGFLVCATETKVDTVPADGLHYLRIPPPPSLGRTDWRGYYELKLIEDGREQRIGFNGTPLLHEPMLPPVLTVFGFRERETVRQHIVPWHGDIPFLFGRLGITPDRLKPLAQPSAQEVRAEFLRLRNSALRADRVVAGYIATAAGAAALSADDVEPIMRSDVVDTDFGREIGYQQFCYHINRLCDFPDALIAACKAKRGYTPQREADNPALFRRCERLRWQCNWCRVTPQCRPTLDGQVAACSPAASAARDEQLRPVREAKD